MAQKIHFMLINAITFKFGTSPGMYAAGPLLTDSILKRVDIESLVYNSTALNKDFDHQKADGTIALTSAFNNTDVLTIHFRSPIEF